MEDILDKLGKILEDRKSSSSKDSYIATLYEKGNNHICDKVIEEARELVEATRESENQIIHESADLLFHVLVLLASHDIKYARILEELENRFGTSGIEEKNNRKWWGNKMLSGISPWSILLILIIVVVLFGTKKLRNVGADLGAAMKSFKKSSKEDSTSNKTIDDDNQNKNT